MTKIIFVANNLPSIINFRSGILRALLNNGVDVLAVAPLEGKNNNKQVNFQTPDFPKLRILPINISPRGNNPFIDLKLIFDLYKIYQTEKPDFIFHYTIKPNIYGSIAAWLAGVPSIAVTTGLGYTFIQENWIAKIARMLYWFAFHFPKEVWLLNNDDLKTFLEYKLVKPEKAVLLNSEGVNLEYFNPNVSGCGQVESNKAQEINANLSNLETCNLKLETKHSFSYLLIARMLWDKGIGEFIEAARILREKYHYTQFCLLGAVGVENPSAITRMQMDKWVNEGVINYLGITNDVRPYIANADCIVLPSYYREGVPRTLLEAAAMAKPIITTNSVGCKEVVDDGINGYLCEPKNAQDLADKMEKMLNLSSSARADMGKKGREKVEREFDEKIIIGEYLKALKRFGVMN